MPTLNSPKINILAKPAGITLRDHTNHVVAEMLLWLKMHPALSKKYSGLFETSLEEVLPQVAKDHDLGKCMKPWQNACQADFKVFENWLKTNPGKCWEDFERANPNLAGKELKSVGMRHEFYSPILLKDRELELSALASILAHHGKLSSAHAHRWEVAKQPQILQDCGDAGKMRKTISRIKQELDLLESQFDADESTDLPAKELMRNTVIRGALQIADQRASAMEEAGETPQYQPFSYNWNPDWEHRPVQKKAIENWELPLLLLKATTGAGKTDAAFLWAQKQIGSNRADHMIIAMPTRFTANAISVKATAQMSQSGLYHSSAWHHLYFSTVEQDFKLRKQADAQHRYSRLLLAPTTVCTIDHLLIAMTLMREDHHQILTQLASSCVVIDEADFYDSFVQANLIELLKVLRIWKIPVMLMSASLPDSAVQLYRKSGFEIEAIVDGNTEAEYKRERFVLESFQEYEHISELAQQVIDIHKGEAVIVYVNVVQKAIDLYNAISNSVDVPVVVYHSEFTEIDKTKKEARILSLLGETAWANEKKPQAIVILTQIGEMSINISASCMVSDLCPMDRLIQRAGRLQRFSEKACGRMWIMKPMKLNPKTEETSFYPAPYGSFLQKEGWISTKPILKTEKFFLEAVGEVFTNGRLDAYNNCVYKNLEDFDLEAAQNSALLPKYIRRNIFIRSENDLKEDEDETGEWSSRNMEPQQEIFINEALNEFSSAFEKGFTYRQYQNLVMKYGIKVRYYEVEKLLGRNSRDENFSPKIFEHRTHVAKKEKTIFVLKEGYYSLKSGFNRNGKEKTLF